MQYKISNFMGKNIDVPEVRTALKSIERQIRVIRNHLCSLPFESEPSEFLKVLSDWQYQKKHSEDNNGG